MSRGMSSVSCYLVFVFAVACTSCIAALLDDFKKEFASPPRQYGPHPFYHWINGNIRKEALDSDLDAMRDAGYGGAVIYDVNAGLPPGDVEYGSDAWLDLVVHTVDGLKQRGQLAAMHNAPGYSGIGSTKLPLNLTMKQLVWTESRVSSEDDMGAPLQKPFSKLGVYEDLYTLAYPVQPGEGSVFKDAVTAVRINGQLQNTTFNIIDRANPLRLTSSSQTLDIEMDSLFTAQSIAIYRIPETPKNTFDGARDFPPTWSLQVSNDSVAWTKITVSGNFPALREMDAPAVLTFGMTVAKNFRLQPDGPSWVTGLDIASSSRLTNWAVKAHGAPGKALMNPPITNNAPSSIDPASVLDVSEYLQANGSLFWKPTNGTYTVVRLGYTLTAQEMPATPDDQKPALSVDLFSKAAIDAHFDTHLNRVIEALQPYTPSTFYGFEIDSYELGMQNWGGELDADFKSLRGYEISPWILAATGRILGSVEQTEQFLYDFRLTHANLVATNCYEYLQLRLAENNLQLLVEPYGDGPFDSLELAETADLAYGEFWAHYTYGSDSYSILGASSSDEKRDNLVPSEAFTGQPDDSAWTEHPYNLKAEGDRMMTFGVNRLLLHTFVHQPADNAFPGMTFGPFGSHFDRMNTWSRQAVGWTQYLARVSFLMQQAQRVSDIACFVGEEPTASLPMTYKTPYDVPLQYQADLFGRANLLKLQAKNAKALYPSGAGYSLLILPSMPSASVQVLSKLIELAQGGVPILLLDQVPTRSIGLNDSNAKVTSLANQLLDMRSNGNVFASNATADVINAVGIPAHLTFNASANDAAIYYLHKTIDGDDLYFITNNLRNPVSTELSVHGCGAVEVWDPMSGEISSTISSVCDNNRTIVSYSFDNSEAIIIRVQHGIEAKDTLVKVFENGSQLFPPVFRRTKSATPWANVSTSFTTSFWAKPEIPQFGTTGYLFYPTGAAAYGTDHALSSVAMGNNGIELGEATTAAPVTVLSLTNAANNFSISGWTHFAIVYTDNQPSLYVNGVLAATGKKSSSTVHPGIDTSDTVAKMNNRFVGDIAGLKVTNRSLSGAAVMAEFTNGLPPPPTAPPVKKLSNSLLFRENGNYTLVFAASNRSLTIGDAAAMAINGTWTAVFPASHLPASRGGKDLTTTLGLGPLKEHPDFDIKHFSGTMKYYTRIEPPTDFASSFSGQARYLLNLGRVENIAGVIVNGKNIGLSWLPPYELDITSAFNPHIQNDLTVEVTNCWPNRLIGDESLQAEAAYNSTTQNFAVETWPDWFANAERTEATTESATWGDSRATRKPGERVTFAAWKHYNASDPLFESGLLGPVTLIKAIEISMFM